MKMPCAKCLLTKNANAIDSLTYSPTKYTRYMVHVHVCHMFCLHTCSPNGCREDAERARSSVRVIGGRPVQVTFAKRRSKEGKDGGKGQEKQEMKGDGSLGDDYGCVCACVCVCVCACVRACVCVCVFVWRAH